VKGFVAAVAALAAVVLLGGCVNLPAAGTFTDTGQLPDSPGAAQQGVQLVPIPPGSQWQPAQIVKGFLAATGATWDGQRDSLGVARQYLSAGFAKHWRPTLAATVIDTAPAVVGVPFSPHVTGGHAVAQVSVTSQHLSTLKSANANVAGSILQSSMPKPYVYDFELVQAGGKWRIASITGPGIRVSKPGVPDDDSILLLENADFLRDYQPRNLYFPAVAAPHTLVPLPVYIPNPSGPLGVQPLAAGLTSPPPPGSNWLYKSVSTAFAGTSLSTQVQADSNQAIVTLRRKKAGKIGQARLAEMEAQLVWTLTSSPYSAASGIQSVLFQIGTKAPVLLQPRYAGWVPAQAPGALYFQMPGDGGYPDFDMVSTAAATGPSKKEAPAYPTQVNPVRLGTGPLWAVAVSPPSASDAFRTPVFAGCRNKTVYIAQLGLESTVTTQTIANPCTSLSWDGNGYLWVTTASGVFRIKVSAQGLQVVPVTIPVQFPSSDSFAALKLAPDGVRVAMIVRHGQDSASLYITSISQKGKLLIYLARAQHFLTVGPELTDPIALTWWGSDHLLVLDKKDGVNTLFEVPLNGGLSTPFPAPADAVSIAGNGTSVAVGTMGASGPAVRVARELGGAWHRIAGASSPAYPG